jgi:hypothetical protein
LEPVLKGISHARIGEGGTRDRNVVERRAGTAQTYDPNYPICIQTYGRDGNSAQPNASLTRISRVQVPTEPGASAPTDLTRQTASIALTAQSGRHPHH